MQIKTENLSFSYNPKTKSMAVRALDDVSLTINEGEFFGIIGKTGSGKTTFVQHLNGLIKCQKNSGKIIVGEYELHQKKCDYKGLRSKLGMVFQYPEQQLFAETIFDDVCFGLNNFCPNMTAEEKERRVKEAIEICGLDYAEVKDKSPFELSGGQKRRVAIAGVIVSRPEVLVLDEPVAGLDPKGKRDFLQLLHRLKESFVKTLIIVTHDMNIVAEHCDRTAVFSNGKLLTAGTPSEIFADERVEKELALPTTAYLEKQLKSVGVNLSTNLRVDDFERAVTAYFGTQKGVRQ